MLRETIGDQPRARLFGVNASRAIPQLTFTNVNNSSLFSEIKEMDKKKDFRGQWFRCNSTIDLLQSQYKTQGRAELPEMEGRTPEREGPTRRRQGQPPRKRKTREGRDNPREGRAKHPEGRTKSIMHDFRYRHRTPRQDKTKTRQDKTRQDKTRQDKTRQNKTNEKKKREEKKTEKQQEN